MAFCIASLQWRATQAVPVTVSRPCKVAPRNLKEAHRASYAHLRKLAAELLYELSRFVLPLIALLAGAFSAREVVGDLQQGGKRHQH